MNHYKNSQRGFLRQLLLIAIVLFLIASFFKIDIQSVIESPAMQKNWTYVTKVGTVVWKGYLEEPTKYLWNSVLAGFIKEAFLQNVDNLKALTEGNTDKIKLTPAIPNNWLPLINPGHLDDSLIGQ